jgi:hypothetical protein
MTEPTPQQPAQPPWDYLLIADEHDGSGEPQMMLLTTEQAKLIRAFVLMVTIPQRVQFIPCVKLCPQWSREQS